jgi:hypothetical protein
VTGTCECLSLLGPTLGGGQGWLEGRYGLALDNIVEAQVVIADGTLITASKDSHPDLVCTIVLSTEDQNTEHRVHLELFANDYSVNI